MIFRKQSCEAEPQGMALQQRDEDQRLKLGTYRDENPSSATEELLPSASYRTSLSLSFLTYGLE